MKNRTILHVDLNNFYASVERILNPELNDKFIGVCGSIENRHGIILAKSENAKKLGVKTGMVIKDALKLCPNLVLIEANHDNYIKYSKLVRDIYRDYSNKIESFGIDECWIDVTDSVKLFGGGEKIAVCSPSVSILEEKAFDGKNILEIEDDMTECILR